MSNKINHYALVGGNIVDVVAGNLISGHSLIIKDGMITVSYTHLTLPTTPYV